MALVVLPHHLRLSEPEAGGNGVDSENMEDWGYKRAKANIFGHLARQDLPNVTVRELGYGKLG